MTDVTRSAEVATKHTPIDQNRPADACAERHQDRIAHVPSRADPCLARHRRERVVEQVYRSIELFRPV
jgi:hypothetical protein